MLSLAVSLGSADLACAQRQPVYQPIGSDTEGALAVSLTEPLHILLPAPLSEAGLAKEYKHPADRANYLADVAARRRALETAAKSWRLSPVSFIDDAEYNRLKADRQAHHLVLEFGLEYYSNQHSSVSFPALQLGLIGKIDVPNVLFIKRFADSQPLAYQLFNTSSKTIIIERWPFWQMVFHTSDLISTVQQMQAYLTQRVQGQKQRDIDRAAEGRVGQQAALLTSKTLLLASTQVDAKLPESKIRQLYPFPLQLVDQAEVEAAAAAADPRYLYLRFVTTYGKRGFQLLDAASGQLVGYAEFLAIRPATFGQLTEPDLVQVVKTASGK